MYRTKKRLKTALCNGLKNWDKEQAENKPIFSTPNRLAKGRVQVFYILQADSSAVRSDLVHDCKSGRFFFASPSLSR